MTTLGMILWIPVGLAALFTSTLLTAICVHILNPKSAFMAKTSENLLERDLEKAIIDEQLKIPTAAYSILPGAGATLFFIAFLDHFHETASKLQSWKRQ